MTWEEINEQEKSKETEPKQCETELKIGCEGCPFGIIVCTNPKYKEKL